MTQNTLPPGCRISHDRRVVRGYTVEYWHVLAPNPEATPDDMTMIEISHGYFTKRALLAAIASGEAWLESH